MAKKAKTTRRDPAARSTKAGKASGKAFPLIGRNDLNKLLEQAGIFQSRANAANGSLGEIIRDYVKKKHLHAGAFRTINRWKRLGMRDPQALWLELAHIDDMREKANLDKLAKAQGQLLPAISDDEDDEENQADNVVTIPREVEERAGDNAA